MKILYPLLIVAAFILIIIHGLWPDNFNVDYITIVLLVFLAIPFLAPYLSKARLFGAEFVFKDEIKAAHKLVQQSVEQAKEEKKKVLPFETFKLSAVRELVGSDPVLALAALRIEIERTLRAAVDYLDIPVKSKLPLARLIDIIERNELLQPNQVEALRKIVNMGNKAVHGTPISSEEASQIIDLTEELNSSFSTGYSIDFSPNPDYVNQGLKCEWEHCIENMPLLEKETEYSCPVFGHNCPGGTEKTGKCKKNLQDGG